MIKAFWQPASHPHLEDVVVVDDGVEYLVQLVEEVNDLAAAERRTLYPMTSNEIKTNYL